MPLEMEILGNKKKKPAHADTCPTQATIAASKDSASVQALLLGVARGPVLRELARAAREARSFPFLSMGLGLH